MNYERLQRLTTSGDLEAASRLLSEAVRRGDLENEVIARLALGDAEGLAQLVADAWGEGRLEEVSRLGQHLGLRLDADVLDALEDLRRSPLREEDAGGTILLLPRADIIAALYQARVEHHGLGSADTGPVSTGLTSVAVAICVDAPRRLIFSVGTCTSRHPSPGVVWPELQPWRRRLERNTERAQAWAGAHEASLFTVPCFERSELVDELEREASDPMNRLDALLESPSADAWRDLIALLRKWPGPAPVGEALTRAEEGLASWPDGLRVAGLRWLRGGGFRTAQPHRVLHRVFKAEISNEHISLLAECDFLGVHSVHLVFPYGAAGWRSVDLFHSELIRFFESDAVRTLRGLTIENFELIPPVLSALLHSEALAGLERLEIIPPRWQRQKAYSSRDLGPDPRLPRLRALVLHRLSIKESALSRLLQCTPSLRELALSRMPIGNGALRVIAGQVRALELRNVAFKRRAMNLITRLDWQLERLTLASSPIGPAQLIALISEHTRELALRDPFSEKDRAHLKAFAQQPLPNLERLTLFGGLDLGFANTLARMSLPSLIELSVNSWISPNSLDLLKASPHAHAIRIRGE